MRASFEVPGWNQQLPGYFEPTWHYSSSPGPDTSSSLGVAFSPTPALPRLLLADVMCSNPVLSIPAQAHPALVQISLWLLVLSVDSDTDLVTASDPCLGRERSEPSARCQPGCPCLCRGGHRGACGGPMTFVALLPDPWHPDPWRPQDDDCSCPPFGRVAGPAPTSAPTCAQGDRVWRTSPQRAPVRGADAARGRSSSSSALCRQPPTSPFFSLLTF